MGSLVSLKHVESYQPDLVLHAMRSCLAPLGGMAAFIRPRQRVLLKPNILGGFRPERAATTHPSVVRAAILLAQEVGATVLVGDSPGVGSLEWAAKASGILAVVEETGATLADFEATQDFDQPANTLAKRLTLARAVADADAIVSLPKLKTHAQMTFTGAIKNQYGLIPGTRKSQWHFRLQERKWLAALILDVHRIALPALAIMDAIVGMEGKGPSGGRPRQIGALIAGRDFAAVDTLACALIGIDPQSVPVLEAAQRHRIGATSLPELDVVGDDWRALRVPDFEKVSHLEDVLRLVPLPRRALDWIRDQWTARPRIVEGRCIECGVCVEACPVELPAIQPESLNVDDVRCIRCYCCHEFCPNQAIELAPSFLARWLDFQSLSHRVGKVLWGAKARTPK